MQFEARYIPLGENTYEHNIINPVKYLIMYKLFCVLCAKK